MYAPELIGVYVIHTLLDILLAFVLYQFYRNYGRRYLLYWAMSWTALSVRHAVGMFSNWGATHLPPTDPIRIAASAISLTAALLQVLWLLEGAYELQVAESLSTRTRKILLLTALFIGPMLMAISTPMATGPRIIFRMGLHSLILGIAFVGAAAAIAMHGGWRKEVGRRIISVAFLLYGIQRLMGFILTLSMVYPTLRAVGGFLATRLLFLELLDFFLHTMMGLGMVIWFLEAERKKLLEAEEKMRQSQKLEAVGRLAGGVAHDFNNILTVILGYSELLSMQLSDGDRSKDAREIHRAAERASSLTNQLLAFSRKQVFQPRVLNLNEVVTGMDGLLRKLIPESIELSINLGQDIHNVKADPSQMSQVLMNLVLNARDAMPDGGHLTVGTTNAFRPHGVPFDSVSHGAGGSVVLSVADTGVGMDEETKSKIFDPFFTTKKLGEGTGLGLSTVYGIVKQNGGHIEIQGEPGKGSCFEVLLPAVDLPADESETKPSTDVRGGETVLLVEDDRGVREYLHGALESMGYVVLEASNADEAMRLSREHQGALDLLVTDVVMPKLNGKQLAEKLRDSRMDLRIIFVSGHTERKELGVILNSNDSFLQKPFTGEDLARRIRESLSSPGSGNST